MWRRMKRISHSCNVIFTSHKSKTRRGSLLYHRHFPSAWISNYIHCKVWDEITCTFSNFNGKHRWSLGMDKLFHPTLYNGRNYMSMLGLKLIHVSKKGPGINKGHSILCYRVWFFGSKAGFTFAAVPHAILCCIGPRYIESIQFPIDAP